MRAIVHIGFEKTGTTSIQKAMKQNAAVLAAASMHYCELCTAGGRHDFLPYLMARCEIAANSVEMVAAFGDQAAARDLVRRALADEIGRTTCGTMVFSAEHCSTQLYTAECVSRLHNFLKEFFENIEVIIYLRRQDRLAASYYSTHLRMGGCISDPFAAAHKGLLDFNHLLFRWISVMGAGNVTVHIYDDIVTAGLSVVQHFATTLGLPSLADDCLENCRLTPVEQELLLMINAQMGPFDGNTIRSAISLVSSQMNSRLQHKISRSEALEFMQAFEESNETVREHMFPHKAHLFDDDYSEYPDTPYSSNEALAALAINALAEGGRIISDLESEIRRLRNA